MPEVIDADFEVVSGPLRVGDEHPTQKGWFLTDQVDRRGRPLWYKPPHVAWKIIRTACWVIVGLLVLLACVGVLTEGQ